MALYKLHISRPSGAAPTQPFDTAEEAWFWFIAAQEARVDGARFSAGLGQIPRPCESIDILKVLDKLYRNRTLLREHLLVLRHYGRRRLPPDPLRVKEMRAHTLWEEALDALGDAFEEKGIIRPRFNQMIKWHTEALAYASVAAE